MGSPSPRISKGSHSPAIPHCNMQHPVRTCDMDYIPKMPGNKSLWYGAVQQRFCIDSIRAEA